MKRTDLFKHFDRRTNQPTNKQTATKTIQYIKKSINIHKTHQYISKSYKILQNPYHTLTKFREGIDPMHISVSIEQNSKIPCKTECSISAEETEKPEPEAEDNFRIFRPATEIESLSRRHAASPRPHARTKRIRFPGWGTSKKDAQPQTSDIHTYIHTCKTTLWVIRRFGNGGERT